MVCHLTGRGTWMYVIALASLKGLESLLLYLHKWKTGEDYGNLKYVYKQSRHV